MKNSARRVDLKNKTIVIMYMLYFGDMVSITPFLEVLRRDLEYRAANWKIEAGRPDGSPWDIKDYADGSCHASQVLDGRRGNRYRSLLHGSADRD